MRDFRNFNLIFIFTLAALIATVYSIDLGIDRSNSKADPIVKPDEQLGWVFTGKRSQAQFGLGNFILGFNSLGLRDDNNKLLKPVHMILLGNSVTMAQHVPLDKTFTARLRAINAGFDGYDTYQQRNRYKRDLYRLNPDLLGIVVVGSDIMTESQSKQKIKDTLASNRDFRNHSILDFKPIYDYIFEPKEDIAAKDEYYLGTVSNPINQSVWCEWTNTIIQIRSVSKNAKFFIVLSPPRSQVTAYRDGKRNFWLNDNLDKFCNEHDILLIDLLPSLAKFDPKLTYHDYVHYNGYGHRIVADEIAKQLLLCCSQHEIAP